MIREAFLRKRILRSRRISRFGVFCSHVYLTRLAELSFRNRFEKAVATYALSETKLNNLCVRLTTRSSFEETKVAMRITQAVVNSVFGPLGRARQLTKKQRERFGDFLKDRLNQWKPGTITERAARLVAEHIGRLSPDDFDAPLADIITELLLASDSDDSSGAAGGAAIDASQADSLADSVGKALGDMGAGEALLSVVVSKKPDKGRKSGADKANEGGRLTLPPAQARAPGEARDYHLGQPLDPKRPDDLQPFSSAKLQSFGRNGSRGAKHSRATNSRAAKNKKRSPARQVPVSELF